jgi:hypothetical protein
MAPDFQGEPERGLKERARLGESFVDRRLAADYHVLREVDAQALAKREARLAKGFPEHAKMTAREVKEQRRSREVLRVQDVGLDFNVITAAFSWLDIGAAQSAEDRADCLRFTRELLGGVIERVPVVDDPRRQEIDGLASSFDSWVFKVVARTIPLMTAAERPDVLWQPILNLGAPAHHWVERFLWEWFTDGSRSSGSSAQFLRIWREMILYALDHPRWDAAVNPEGSLGSVVNKLLGFDQRWTSHSRGEESAAKADTLNEVFEKAARRWFGMPNVVRGFLRFATPPGAAGLLLPGIFWVAKAVEGFDPYDWRHGMEDSLVGFLEACRQREAAEISANAELRQAFLGLLSTLVSRGGHAAIALRDRVIGS